MNLKSQVAIVTGGAKGIGRGVSRRLAAEGAAVVIADIDPDASEATTAEIEAAGGRAVAIGCDVANPVQVDDLMARTVDELAQPTPKRPRTRSPSAIPVRQTTSPAPSPTWRRLTHGTSPANAYSSTVAWMRSSGRPASTPDSTAILSPACFPTKGRYCILRECGPSRRFQ